MKNLFRILPLVAALLFICITPVAAAEGDEIALESPVIYGDFNNWAIEGENAKPLTETEPGSGIFKASYNFEAYTGTGEGYSVFVCVTKKDYGQYGWGAGEQYTLSGEAAAMGSVSYFKPTVSGLYEFTYDSKTHVTTILPPEVFFEKPVLYGDFNNWAIEGENAIPLTETGEGTGIFQGTVAFEAYNGTGDGYTAIVCVSKKNYGQYGWGAGTQYTLSGEAAGFGSKSSFKPEVSGNYLVSYDSSTNKTTITLIQDEDPATTGEGTTAAENTGAGTAADTKAPATSDTGIMIYIAGGVIGAAAAVLSARKIKK